MQAGSLSAGGLSDDPDLASTGDVAYMPPTDPVGDATGIIGGLQGTSMDPIEVERSSDGTIGDVAAGLVDTGVPLGIVPCGTTNVLAREFGISLFTGAATRELECTVRTVRVPVWRVGEHVAMLGVGVGWDARVMWVVPPVLKRRLGRQPQMGGKPGPVRPLGAFLLLPGAVQNDHRLGRWRQSPRSPRYRREEW